VWDIMSPEGEGSCGSAGSAARRPELLGMAITAGDALMKFVGSALKTRPAAAV
jgi:hypothetical protein